MATDIPKTLPNPFTDGEYQMIEDSLDLARTSYRRTQKQRPEFEGVAKQLEHEITLLIAKVNQTRPAK